MSVSRVIAVLEAALEGDYANLRRLAGDVAQECADAGDDANAKRLRAMIRRRGMPLQASAAQSLPVDGVSRLPLVDEEPWPSTPAILNGDVQVTVGRFLHDIQNAKRLSEGGLLTRFGLMLSGPPGTGKTLLAGHIAAQLRRPFLVARLDSLISSRLGETAKNIRQIFEFAPTKGAVLFLDEIDALAKMRDDRQELGELKRVVNTVIQGLDSLDDQAVVIAATNHAQLLDPAIWRRFPYRADLGLPDEATRSALWLHFLYEGATTKLRRAQLYALMSEGFSGADIENLALAARRLSLLQNIPLPEASLLWAVASAKPPSLVFPQNQSLTSKQRGEVVRAVKAKDGKIVVLEEVLGMSRSGIYKHLEGEAQKRANAKQDATRKRVAPWLEPEDAKALARIQKREKLPSRIAAFRRLVAIYTESPAE